VNVELIGELARLRRDHLLAEALAYRLARAGHPRARHGVRRHVARAMRALGYAALTLGDALAESR
jgi:hypothetical protein